MVGGELRGLTKLIIESKEHAIDRMKEHAASLGAMPWSALDLSPLKSTKCHKKYWLMEPRLLLKKNNSLIIVN